MLSVTDLLTIQKKPNIKDVSLQLFQEFYKEHLCGRVFHFELDDTDRPSIKLRFKEENLCHLLGIQYIVAKLKNKHEYAGKTGYQKLENGTLTFDFLKATDRTWFKSKRNRMLYFPFVHQIVQNPTVIVFSNDGLNTNLDVDALVVCSLNEGGVSITVSPSFTPALSTLQKPVVIASAITANFSSGSSQVSGILK